MIIAWGEDDIREYMKVILTENPDNIILIDKYVMGTEVEVDAICDGKDILIPGIMEHVERTGIHSGDSIAIYPAQNLTDEITEKLIENTRELALGLSTRGLINIQYIVKNSQIYVIEVNPRSSRTVPYISKVTGVPMIRLATECMLGKELKKLGYGTGLYRRSPYVAVKVPIFSFEKLTDLDTHLGPEMKSTGEVLGIGKSLDEALFKGLCAAGYNMDRKSRKGVLITVRDSDKPEIAPIAKKYSEIGYKLYATAGTAAVLHRAGMNVTVVNKISEGGKDTTFDLLQSGKVNLLICTSSRGRIPSDDDVKLRRLAVTLAIPGLTSLDTANALANSLRSKYSQGNIELVDINRMRTEKQRLSFVKMEGCGNDYIYIDCHTHTITNMESIAVTLSDRHFGVGGDGVVFICPSDVADVQMRMFNADGSEGMMCGNAIRCVGKYIYDTGKVKNREVTIETKSGIKKLTLYVRNNEVTSARVDMGAPDFDPRNIPVRLQGEVIDRKVELAGAVRHITCLSMGNPHCVIVVDDVDNADVAGIGSEIENDPLFPDRVNVEFVQVLDEVTCKVRFWERGTGETYACGTGTCAAVVAMTRLGKFKRGDKVTVKVKGGELTVQYADDTVYLTGDAVEVYKGVVRI